MNPITVTVNRTRTNRYGEASTVASHTVSNCVYAPQMSRETENRSDTVTTRATLFVPAGANIMATDTITFPDGSRWLVDGDPASWQHPLTGWSPGMTVTLERVTG